jgi:hypothetical protein
VSHHIEARRAGRRSAICFVSDFSRASIAHVGARLILAAPAPGVERTLVLFDDADNVLAKQLEAARVVVFGHCTPRREKRVSYRRKQRQEISPGGRDALPLM